MPRAKKEEIPEELPPAPLQQLQALTAHAWRMVDGLADDSPTSDTLKTMNLLKQLIVGNATLEQSIAKQEALRGVKETQTDINLDEQRLEIYEILLERLSTPKYIEDLRVSITTTVERMRAKGVRSYIRPPSTYFADVEDED